MRAISDRFSALVVRGGPGIDLANEKEVRIEKVADDAAECDELRTVADAEIGPGAFTRVLLERRHQPVARGAGQHRARENDGVPLLLLFERSPDFPERV